MIQNIAKGSGARGLAEYLLQERDHAGVKRERIVIMEGSTIQGQTPRDIAHEFAALRGLRPTLSNAIAHVSLRPDPKNDRRLSDIEMSAMAVEYAQAMGFDTYFIVRHDDHVHIEASRIRLDGTVVSDSKDFERGERIVRLLEIKYGLTKVAESHLLNPDASRTHRKALTMAQISMMEKGNTPPSQIIADLIDAKLAEGGCTVVELCSRLEEMGVNVRPNLASTGKLNGLAYELNGITVTSNALGRGYTFGNLVKKGLNYEQSRDFEELRSLRDRRARAGLGVVETDWTGAGGDHGAVENSAGNSAEISGGLRFEAGAGGDQHGLAGRGDAGGSDFPPFHAEGSAGGSERYRDPGREGGAGDREGNEIDQRRDREGAEVRGLAQPGEPGQGGGPAEAGLLGRTNDLGHIARICDLANIPPDPTPYNSGKSRRGGVDAGSAETDRKREADRNILRGTGHQPTNPELHKVSNGLEVKRDRTRQAVMKSLKALPDSHYIVGIYDPKTKKMQRREVAAEQVEKNIAWMKRQNALGNEVYFTPKSHRFTLIDDVSSAQVEAMKRDGIAPALLTETSPNNFQAWIAIDAEVAAEERSAIGASLAKRYQGDIASTAYHHLGRLPGFTNNKPKHEQAATGFQPYVLAREAVYRVAERGAELLEKAKDWLSEQAKLVAIRAETVNPTDHRPDRESKFLPFRSTPEQEFRRIAKNVMAEIEVKGQRIDMSQVDYMTCQRMYVIGFGPDDIKTALSENLDRAKKNAEKYTETTAAKAVVSPWAMENRAKHMAEMAAAQRKRDDENAKAEIARKNQYRGASYSPSSPSIKGPSCDM